MKYIIILFLTVFVNVLSAQTTKDSIVFNKNGTASFVSFKAGSVSENANQTQLLARFLPVRSGTDELRATATPMNSKLNGKNFSHYSYQQYYKGKRVENGMYKIHKVDATIKSMNGNFIPSLTMDVTPSISEASALEIAKKSIGALKYAWEDDFFANNFYKGKKTPPKAELVICKDVTITNQDVYSLAYKFEIFSISPKNNRQYIYVDAHSGLVINKQQISINIDGTAQTRYSGTQTINTTQISTNPLNYLLNDPTKNIEMINCDFSDGTIYDYSGGDSHITTPPINDNDNVWTDNTNYYRYNGLYDALWAIETTQDYFVQKIGSIGLNNNAGVLAFYNYPDFYSGYTPNNDGTISLKCVSYHWDNAAWSGYTSDGAGLFLIGSGRSIFNSLTSIDVLGHEYGHGVYATIIGTIDYSKEPGAINEGLSDIWGTCVEYWAKNNYTFPTDDKKVMWEMGEEIMADGSTCLRTISNPGLNSLPSTYNAGLWKSTAGVPDFDLNDNCGVHTNCSVLSFWFYLLTTGSTGGVNDNGYSYTVNGIGIEDASTIVYEAESRLIMSDGYHEVRLASIQAAKDLFGENSCEVASVLQAWAAVGLGQEVVGNNDLTLTTDISNQNLDYFAFDQIVASDIISSASNVTMTASNSIDFKPGFNATGNSYLHASIISCSSDNSLKSDVVSSNQIAATESNIKPQIDNEAEDNTICSISPNPTTDNIKIASSKNINGIAIYNVLGIEIYSNNLINNSTFSMSISSFAKGIYFIHCDIEGKSIIKSILKE